MGPEDLIIGDDGKPVAHRQGVFVGRADRRARADAPVDPQRLEGRPVQDRHAVHVHGQHGVELGDEHPRDPAHADRQGPDDRRIQDPAHHLFRRLLLGDGRLRRSDPARHDLFRALGLHLAARPADRRAGRSRQFDPPADPEARSRCAAVSGRADRTRRKTRLAGLCRCRGRAALSRAATRITSSGTSAAPASGRLPAGAARTARRRAGARRTRSSSTATSPMAASGNTNCRRSSSSTSTPTRPISKPRPRWG